jgi:Pyruvate/2-oxoacid:ferredoxin oxidoreductase delta subunit
MPHDIYRQLAQRLDTIPNGFPATESGAELRLLAKLFSPDQAALAAVMRLTFESAEDIGSRAGVDRNTSYRTLKTMSRQGLIYIQKGDGELTFALMPFVVGIYEYQLPRMDAELAELFEAYLQESRGSTIYGPTPIHRVIPVDEAIPANFEIFPYESAVAIIEGAKSWAVRDCICRVQKRLIGDGCDHPVENCLVFAPVEGVFDHSKVDRAVTKEEALRILYETEEAGLVHTTGNYRDQHSYICNCCTCSCGILRGVAEFGILSAVGHSDFRAVVDAQTCAACGDCIDRCQFGALSIPEDMCVVDILHCVGCGQCVTVCPTDALEMVRRLAGELPPLPIDHKEWMVQRAQERGISLSKLQ